MGDAAETLRGILSAYFTRSGLWFGLSVSSQALSVLLGAATVLLDQASLEVGIAVGVASLCGSSGRWRADILRGRAEFLLRQVEYHDGFGWSLDSKLAADAVSQAISFRRKAKKRGGEQGNFFASALPHGPQRALSNLQESAWWTEQLCSYLAPRAVALFALITVLSLWSMLVAASLVRADDPLAVSSLLTSTICLAFSTDFVRLPLGYYRLSAEARRIGRAAAADERGGLSAERGALMLLHEYQIDREKGPVIPDWIWRCRRDHLNEIWATFGGVDQQSR